MGDAIEGQEQADINITFLFFFLRKPSFRKGDSTTRAIKGPFPPKKAGKELTMLKEDFTFNKLLYVNGELNLILRCAIFSLIQVLLLFFVQNVWVSGEGEIRGRFPPLFLDPPAAQSSPVIRPSGRKRGKAQEGKGAERERRLNDLYK